MTKNTRKKRMKCNGDKLKERKIIKRRVKITEKRKK